MFLFEGELNEGCSLMIISGSFGDRLLNKEASVILFWYISSNRLHFLKKSINISSFFANVSLEFMLYFIFDFELSLLLE